MKRVRTIEVAPADAEMRLDRWFKRHFPEVGHAHLQKWLRTGQVRVDGGRVKAGLRLASGQRIRVPPLPEGPARAKPVRRRPVSDADAAVLRAAVLHRDDRVLAINKPPGLAVQGGTKVKRHLDAMLDALRFGAGERPRLVHRLDKDTSGVLLLAGDAAAAAALARSFRSKAVRKVYWAMVVGVPRPASGRIDMALAKVPGKTGERVAPAGRSGKKAVTLYRVVAAAGKRAAWLALAPETGRTHQLRAHCAALGTPIVGDGKYGGTGAFLPGGDISRKLHLHARAVRLPHPAGGVLEVTAPLPEHMRATWRYFGYDEDGEDGPQFDP